MIRPLERLRIFAGHRRGTVAVEFALVMPMVMTLYLGGVAVSEAASTWRKLSDATAQTANVTAQYTTMQAADVQGVMAASAQIMSPYATSSMNEAISLVSVSSAGVATVTWSQAYNNGTALAKGSVVVLPTNMLQPNMSVVWVQTSYAYTPVAGATYVPAMTMNDQIYSVPRSSSTIPCADC